MTRPGPHYPDAGARIAFMIGHPVAQTALPAQINAQAAERRAGFVMVPLDLRPPALPGFLDSLRGIANCAGAVLTAPHKQAAAGLVDDRTAAADLAGAVNLVLRHRNGRLSGDNTDGAGFVAALRAARFRIEPARVLLFGCGGAGAAIAAALTQAGTGRIDLVDTDQARADDLAGRLVGCPVRAIPAPASVAAYDLVCNATAIGADGRAMVHPLTGLRTGAMVADVIGHPARTPFLQEAERRGARIQTGPEMARGQMPLILEKFGWLA
ncbi:shikimate dehydrogenase family protein [Pukyongiella litopenaei]|uniref:Shikimate dehydrogenase n=1 Tax=Pukyongiella litopenaei TaxID=2605946 RepID=A0A2S0MT50_9RHOB|nr:ThiF family adenylyltransferase [Pukyongiella litopenaei]AVO39064.1 shikimate dehydrogenase [Pukyongiella litopenaei]